MSCGIANRSIVGWTKMVEVNACDRIEQGNKHYYEVCLMYTPKGGHTVTECIECVDIYTCHLPNLALPLLTN